MVLVGLFLMQIVLACGQNLFKNRFFENAMDPDEDWFCDSCTLQQDSDSFQGSYSGSVTNRYLLKCFVQFGTFQF